VAIDPQILERADNSCELCSDSADLSAFTVDGDSPADIAVCGTCAAQLGGDELDAKHWFCLQGSIWSEVPAVQVVSWRLLNRLTDHAWAQETLDQAYLDDAVMAWAQQGADDEPAVKTVDSNGTQLHDGDSVTLIKDLDVKGGGFTAKRGTLVKNIRLSDDPGLIEGRVNKVGIFLKTEFLKRA